jgi:hypothetical protein
VTGLLRAGPFDYAFFSDTSFAGRPASGAMWALWAVSIFLVGATVIAVVDHARTPRVEPEIVEPEPQFVP